MADAQSPLLDAGPDVADQLTTQLFAVVDEAAGEPVGAPSSKLSTTIGKSRATSRIHPSVSLAAAHLIFVAALPILTEHLQKCGDAMASTTAAVRLNAAILERMSDAAASYVEHLLTETDAAHREEALRLSRDLHDAVGPTITVAIQSLDLAERYRSSDPDRAEAKTALLRDALMEAATDLRELASYTRVVVEPGGLIPALEDCLARCPAEVETELRTVGEMQSIPPHSEREIFLIIREAVRNAVTHSDANAISVSLSLRGTRLQCTVWDNGRGFAAHEPSSEGTGLDSMNERAMLLGGSLTPSSSAAGTEIVLDVPLPSEMTP